MNWERGTLADFMGDLVVYRNLEPQLAGVPGLRETWQEIGLEQYYVPRKTTAEYAAALLRIMADAQRLRGAGQPLQRAFFIGDTLMNDGTAALNVGKAMPMRGFIGSQREAQPATVEIKGELMVANRWGALADYVQWAKDEGLTIDENTALLIDLDKTSLGARGRNDKVIDGARVKAVERTMVAALGDAFRPAAFQALYDTLNQPDYHYLTADNQDYLAYICLMVSGGAYEEKSFWGDVEAGVLRDVECFARACDRQRSAMGGGLLQAHQEVLKGIAAQDPTPFKGFRRREYFETVACMDALEDSASIPEVLAQEIVITAEVASVAIAMAARGALVLGISDKPDEASLPTVESAAQGYTPIHRTAMKLFGETISL